LREAAHYRQQLSLSFERHLHLLARPSFPSSTNEIPHLIAAFQSRTSLHLITTYASCGTLWDRLCDLSFSVDMTESQASSLIAGFMAEEEAMWWSAQMVSAIDWVHRMGFAHRCAASCLHLVYLIWNLYISDIKPQNFLLQPHCRLMLTDFGSSAPLLPYHRSSDSHSAPRYVRKEYCDTPAGTPDYIAPEVLTFAEDAFLHATSPFRHEEDVDRTVRPSDLENRRPSHMGYNVSIDWWSFGATLFEMVTGKTPFYATTVHETYDKIRVAKQPPPLPMTVPLSQGLRAILSQSDIFLPRVYLTDVSKTAHTC